MFKVIGILQKKWANMMGRDQDDSIILPWTSIRYRLQGLGGGSASTSSGKSTTTFNRADKYTANSVDYYTETTDQPYTDAPHRGASTTLTPSGRRLRTRSAPPRRSTRSRKSSAPSTISRTASWTTSGYGTWLKCPAP